ncbi:monocarboxylate transporter 13-like [Glandiceps talaboti]
MSKKTFKSATNLFPEPPDGGWGWFIVLGTFLSTVISAGTWFSFGVFYVAFLNAFNKSKSETAWIGSITVFVFAMSGPLSVALARRVGHRKAVMTGGIVAATGHLLSSFATSIYHLYISYGVITGLGLGLGHVASMEMVGKYFKRRLPIAMGIALAGGGLGQFVLSTTLQAVIDFYGWRGTLLIFSAFTLHMWVAGSLFRPLTAKPNNRQFLKEPHTIESSTLNKNTYALIEDKDVRNEMINTETKEDSQRQCIDPENNVGRYKRQADQQMQDEVFLDLTYYLVRCNSLIHITDLISLKVRRGVDYGMTPTQASFLTAVVGIGQFVGRPGIGIIGNLPKMKPSLIGSTCLAICAVLCIASIYLRSLTGQLIMVCIFGACMGGYMVIMPVIIADFLGRDKMGAGLSVYFQTLGCTALITGPISGFLRDHFGTYYQAFWIAGCSLGVSAVLLLSLFPVHKLVSKRRNGMRQTLHLN